jgi:site-specific DNA-methyltransferase (adenine-specific)
MIDLIEGDCLEVMKTLEDKSFDAIITDPPYGTTACKWDSVIPFEPMWEQLNRIIKPNGAIVLFGSEPFTSSLIMSNTKEFKYRWTWNKIKASNHLNSRRQPLRCIEDICVFYKKQPTYNPQLRDRLKKNIRDPKKEYGKGNNKTYGETKQNYLFNSGREILLEKGYPLDLLEFSQLGSFGNKRVHPTQKPVPLMEYLIKTYTNENETVLDFTMGSGSTMIACQNTNRNGIGIEQDENYFEIAKKRIEENKYKLF